MTDQEIYDRATELLKREPGKEFEAVSIFDQLNTGLGASEGLDVKSIRSALTAKANVGEAGGLRKKGKKFSWEPIPEDAQDVPPNPLPANNNESEDDEGPSPNEEKLTRDHPLFEQIVQLQQDPNFPKSIRKSEEDLLLETISEAKQTANDAQKIIIREVVDERSRIINQAASQRIGVVEGHLNAEKAKVAALQAEKSALEAKVASLEQGDQNAVAAHASGQLKAIAELQPQLDAAKQQIADLQQQLSEANAKLAELAKPAVPLPLPKDPETDPPTKEPVVVAAKRPETEVLISRTAHVAMWTIISVAVVVCAIVGWTILNS